MPTVANDVEVASESTPLIEVLPTSQSTDTVDVDNASQASDENQVLLAEMSAPWPATFERGISLLASPVVTPRQVNLVTKSPKPGSSFLFGRNAVSYFDCTCDVPKGVVRCNCVRTHDDAFNPNRRIIGMKDEALIRRSK